MFPVSFRKAKWDSSVPAWDTSYADIARFTAQHRVAQKAVLWLTQRKGEQILTDTPIKFILMKLDPIRK